MNVVSTLSCQQQTSLALLAVTVLDLASNISINSSCTDIITRSWKKYGMSHSEEKKKKKKKKSAGPAKHAAFIYDTHQLQLGLFSQLTIILRTLMVPVNSTVGNQRLSTPTFPDEPGVKFEQLKCHTAVCRSYMLTGMLTNLSWSYRLRTCRQM